MKNQKSKIKNQNGLLFCILIFGFCILAGCGSGTITDTTPSATTTTSLNLVPSQNLYVAAAFFTDPVGSIATVGMSNPYTVQKSLAVTDSSDVLVKSASNRLYVINRGTSTIQVLDPTTLETLGNFSVGNLSNPQDLVVSNGKAFITRLDPYLDSNNKDDLFIVNPTSGTLIKSIDLKSFTTDDGDRLARATKMALVGNHLYILLQDLSKTFKATTEGKVAIVDVTTNALVDADLTEAGTQAILLKGRNPTSIVYNVSLGRLFITDTGFFDDAMNNDPATAFGGIETVEVATNKSLGIVIDDLVFGGYLFSLAFVSDTLAAVTVNAKTIATFNPATLAPLAKSLYTTASGFMPEILADPNGLLWIPERDPAGAGLILMDPATGSIISGPHPVGAFPASMTLIK